MAGKNISCEAVLELNSQAVSSGVTQFSTNLSLNAMTTFM